MSTNENNGESYIENAALADDFTISSGDIIQNMFNKGPVGLFIFPFLHKMIG
jgi:hypothetical protein